ncbi:hypothetical protein [Brevibacillus sp. NRS-1366]|uniref:hypothetical protein n=1 Tax=Brevibacillus sp. NRS-1366 TaxID=3233899 RepID=UPI003D1911C9
MKHREIDATITEFTKGWDKEYIEYLKTSDAGWWLIPRYSTTGDEMLRLIEKANDQGISIRITPKLDFYEVSAHKRVCIGVYEEMTTIQTNKLPSGVALVYLKSKGVDIDQYLDDTV